MNNQVEIYDLEKVEQEPNNLFSNNKIKSADSVVLFLKKF